jgi:hypothetical protein
VLALVLRVVLCLLEFSEWICVVFSSPCGTLLVLNSPCGTLPVFQSPLETDLLQHSMWSCGCVELPFILREELGSLPGYVSCCNHRGSFLALET